MATAAARAASAPGRGARGRNASNKQAQNTELAWCTAYPTRVCRSEGLLASRASGYQTHWLVALVPAAAAPLCRRLKTVTARVDSTLATLPENSARPSRRGHCG